MDTSDLVSDADFLPNAPMPTKPSGKGAPELLSDMSGVFQGIQLIYLIKCFFARASSAADTHSCCTLVVLKSMWN